MSIADMLPRIHWRIIQVGGEMEGDETRSKWLGWVIRRYT